MKTLAAWRSHRGLTQQQLAEAAGTTKGEISRLEAGKRRLTIAWLRRIAQVYRVAPEDLMRPPPGAPREAPEPERAPVRAPAPAPEHRDDGTVVVIDDGMAPTLQAGDEVEIDPEDHDARTPGLFAIREGGRTAVRRVQRAGDRVIVAFDNPSYRPYEASPDDVLVVGRALRRIHRL